MTGVEALTAVVNYSWADERRDFEQMEYAGEPTDGHVFHALVMLDNFLNGTSFTAKDHIDV